MKEPFQCVRKKYFFFFFLFLSTITFSRKIWISIAIYEKRIQRRTKKCDFILLCRVSLYLFSFVSCLFFAPIKRTWKRNDIVTFKKPQEFLSSKPVTVYVDLHQQADKNKNKNRRIKIREIKACGITVSAFLFFIGFGCYSQLHFFHIELNFCGFLMATTEKKNKSVCL